MLPSSKPRSPIHTYAETSTPVFQISTTLNLQTAKPETPPNPHSPKPPAVFSQFFDSGTGSFGDEFVLRNAVIRLGSLGVEFSAFIRDITLGFGRLKSLLPSKVSFELISFENSSSTLRRFTFPSATHACLSFLQRTLLSALIEIARVYYTTKT